MSTDALSNPGSAAMPQETVESRIPQGERTRKFLHMLPGVLVFGMCLIPHYDPLAWHEVAIIAAVSAWIARIYIKKQHTVQRHDEDDFLWPVMGYGISVVVMSFFRATPEFCAAVVAVIAWGDGTAYFAGKLYGRHKLPWNRKKSWAGTLAFIVAAAPMATLAYWFEARPAAPFALAAWCGTVAAIAGAIAESLPVKVTDNLRVGLTAGAACAITYYILAPQYHYIPVAQLAQ